MFDLVSKYLKSDNAYLVVLLDMMFSGKNMIKNKLPSKSMSIEILPTTCSTSLRESSTYLQECEIRLTSHPCSSAGKFHHNETSRHPQEASVCCRPLENLLLISLHWSSSGVNQAIVHTLCQTPVLLPRCFFSESSSTRGKINIGCGQIQIEVI